MIVTTLREKDVYADLGLVQLICSTPDMPTLYAKNSDLPALSRMMEDKPANSGSHCQRTKMMLKSTYRAIKTAMLLSDWTDELPGREDLRAVFSRAGRRVWNGREYQLAAACDVADWPGCLPLNFTRRSQNARSA